MSSASKSVAGFSATTGALATVGTTALAVFAASSVKAAIDFDRSFTRIAAISNTTAGEIEGMKTQVMELAGETAKAPTELADALFFLASAGLDANEVMPALEMSAKASAVGLGETADVANIVASALNAYAKSGLTAAQATDILVAAVREGRAEPEEFANALGRILPIASTVGVTFDQVAASMAALSNIGLDVNEGVTAMRGVLQAIAAPGSQAAQALNEIGLSAQSLLDEISQHGIIGAIRLLDSTVKSQTKTSAQYNNIMRQIVPNVRSLTGVFGLTTQELSKVDGIYKRVANSTGDLDKAFQKTSKSLSFQFQKAVNDIAIAGQKVATVVFPYIVFAAEQVADSIEGILGPFQKLIDLLPDVGSEADSAGFSIGGIYKGLVELANPLEAVRHPIGRFQSAWRSASGQMEETLPLWQQTSQAASAQALQIERLRGRYNESIAIYGKAREGLEGLTLEHRKAAEAARDQRNAERALVSPLFAVLDSADQLQEAQREVNNLRRHGKQDTEAYRDAVLGELEATLAAKDDLRAYAKGLDEAGVKHKNVVKQVQALGREMGLTKTDIRGVIDELDLIPGSVKLTVKADTADAKTDLAALSTSAAQLVAHDYELRVHVKEVHGSPIPTVLLQNLADALETLTTTKWEIKIHALGTAQLDQLRAYRRDILALSKDYDKLKDKADAFRDSVRQGFSAFADLAGGLGDALSSFASAQEKYAQESADYAEAQKEYAEELLKYRIAVDRAAFFHEPPPTQAPPEAPVAPTPPAALDLAGFLEQQVAAAKAFAASLKKLQKAGLSTANLQQLAAMGPAGQEVADALLANQGLIKDMNQAQKAIADVTKTTADKLTDARFGEKIDKLGHDLDRLTRGLERFLENLNLPALNDKTKEFINAIDRLANAMDAVSGKGKNPPHAASGGYVAETGLAVIHKGEMISPAGSGVTVIINGDVTGEEVVDKIERELTQRLQRHGAIFNGAVRT